MEALAIELLGPPAIRFGGGDRRQVAGRQRALLALLALRAPRPVAADLLVDALWGDEELPADPANALQQRISSLRKQLGGDVLTTARGAYALRVEDEAVDVRRFERLVGRGRELLRAGDAVGACTELDTALALWRGDALEGVSDEPWAVAEARRLDELRLAATEERTEAALATGAADDLVPELTRRVEEHPLRERSVAQLMAALLHADRQADALEVYDRTRRHLADELGADPGPGLRAAHRRVLDHGNAPAREATPEAAPTSAPRRTPVPRGPLIGRDTTLELLDGLVDTHRLVTLLGPGGAGKTALAVALVARRQPPRHGIRWVALDAVTDRAAVVGEVAKALEVGARGLGAGSVDASAVVAGVRDRELLLVVDDAGPWREEVAILVEALLDGAPSVRVLTTSRVPLGVAGERRLPLPPLDVPAPAEDDETAVTAPAVRLLVERAREHDPWFDLGAGGVVAAGELVRRLDGLPLAIELAAARLRTRTVTDVLDEVAAGDALAHPDRRGPGRHRSLDAVLSGTWDDLSPAGRAAWAALSVAAGPVDARTADALVAAGGAPDPRRAVTELVDRALVTVDRGPAGVEVRTLGTVRRFGRERLDELGVGDAVRRVHGDRVEAALDATVRRDDPTRFPVDLGAQARWLDEARAVLGAAQAIGDRDRLQRVAGRLGWTWLLGGSAGEGLRWLDRGLAVGDGRPAHPDEVDPAAVDPDAALWASGLRLGAADPLGAGWAEVARRAARTDADRVAAAVHAAVHALHAGDVGTCATRLAEVDAAATALGGWPLGFHRLIRAQVGRLVGHVGTVREDAEAALAALTDPGADWARALAVDVLIDALLAGAAPPTTEVHERTRQLAAEALTWCVDRGRPELESRLRLQLGRALHALGEVDLGRRHLDEAVELARSAGAAVSLGFALLQAGTVARERGEPAAAAASLAEAEELLRGTAAAYGVVEAGVELAAALRASGRHLDADAAARRALAAASAAGDEGLVARATAAVTGDSHATGG